MDGIHDLGGKHGHGAVNFAPDNVVGAPAFHQRWHARVFVSMRALYGGAVRNVDHFRHGVERIDPVAYLSHGYYGRWLGGIETLAVEAGVTTTAAITARTIALGGSADDLIAARPGAARPLTTTNDQAAAQHGARRLVVTAPQFTVGARVRTSGNVVAGHTRLPAYARSRIGTVVAHHDGWVFPDTNALGSGEHPQHLYTVAFGAEELWGDSAEANVTVSLDLFEPYLAAV